MSISFKMKRGYMQAIAKERRNRAMRLCQIDK